MHQLLKKNILWLPPLLIVYNFCANLSNDIYLPSMPKLVQFFDTTSSHLQLTMTAWFAGVAVPQLFFGPLTDRFGRRPIILLGGLLFLCATGICTLSNHIWVLIIGRFFQGIGVCSLNVTTYSILIDLYSFKERISIMNKISMCGTMAPLIGPIIGGYALTYLGWRANFLIIFLMGFVSVIGLWFKMPESNLRLNPNALNFRNILQNYFSLIKNQNLIKHLIPYCLMLGGLIIYLISAPFIIIDKLEILPENFGYTQLPIFSMYVIGSLYLSYHANPAMTKKLSRLGITLVCGSSLFLLLSIFLFDNLLLMILFPMIGYALGLSFCSTPFINEVMSASSMKGYTSAFLGFGMAVSCMFCSWLLGFFYNGTLFPVACLIFMMTLLATIIYFFPHSILLSQQTRRS